MRSAPSGPLRGVAHIPGDKSISHRALMLGAVARGETIIEGLLEGDDVLATAAALRAMGVAIVKAGGVWCVRGGDLQSPAAPLDLGNSGTSARLLTGLMAGYPLRAELTGDASLRKRP